MKQLRAFSKINGQSLKKEHNPIATDMDLHSDEQPDAESPGDLEVITAGNSSIHQT